MTIVDFCAGPGGWDIAAHDLGLDPIGIEHDADTCATRAAAGLRTIRADVTTINLDRLRPLDGLIASPPCTDWSTAGKRAGLNGETGALVLEVDRWVHATRPLWVCAEQVPPALDWWKHFAREWRSLGYSTWAGILDAADYGVPQNRRRAILIARLDGRPAHPPAPTHAEHPTSDLFGATLRPWVTMADALGWLPPDASIGFPRLDDHGDSPDGYRNRDFRTGTEPSFAITEKARLWTWRLRTGNNSHVTSRTGTKAGDGGTEAYERDVDRPAPTVDGKAPGAWSVNTGRDWKPGGTRADAQTVPFDSVAPSVDTKGRWHVQDETGELVYRFTLEDIARLQAFPTGYPFQGTASSRYRQLGNAVPPPLAKAILATVATYQPSNRSSSSR